MARFFAFNRLARRFFDFDYELYYFAGRFRQDNRKVHHRLSVVARDGSNPTFLSAIIRHLVGYPLTLVTGGLGFAFAAFNRDGRALHDFLSGTIVVQASRRIQRTKTRAD